MSAVDCLDPSCSGHGACHHGECHCNPGWGGISCEILKSTCPEQCSNHGTFSTESGTCVCDDKWTGADCSIGEELFFGCCLLDLGLECSLIPRRSTVEMAVELYGPIEMDVLVIVIPGRRLQSFSLRNKRKKKQKLKSTKCTKGWSCTCLLSQ